MAKVLERIFERLLWESRLVLIFAVVSSLVGAAILVAIGVYDVWLVLHDGILGFAGQGMKFKEFQIEAIASVIAAVDAFLIATVLLIFGIGIYELFISKIDAVDKDERSSRVLAIHDLDQLKEKLAKVIIMVLVVTFCKYAISIHYETVQQLLYLAIGALLCSAALYLLGKSGTKHEH